MKAELLNITVQCGECAACSELYPSEFKVVIYDLGADIAFTCPRCSAKQEIEYD